MRQSYWPKIVVSSSSVQGSSTATPLTPNDQVMEVFGLPPVLPLTIDWTCKESTDTKLDVQSQEGVAGLATNCRMLFDIQSNHQDKKFTNVQLTMEYEPTNRLLGTLAIPLLMVDNAIALKLLLPYQLLQVQPPVAPLLKFQQLMGILYGVAGIAHFVDLLLGNSKILQLAGCPTPFAMLPIQGQALALLWCSAGPLSFVASRMVGLETVGLVFYGVVEVACAALVSSLSATTTANGVVDPLANALGVQALVAASYVYSSRQQRQRHDNDESTRVESDTVK